MPNDDIPEKLVTLLHAISEDRELSNWFLGLQKLPETARHTELGGMASRMRAAGEDAGVVDAVAALARTDFYAAACRTLREL